VKAAKKTAKKAKKAAKKGGQEGQEEDQEALALLHCDRKQALSFGSAFFLCLPYEGH